MGAAHEQELVGEVGELADGPVGVEVGERVAGEGAELAGPEAFRLGAVGLGAAVGLAHEHGEARASGGRGAQRSVGQGGEEGQAEGEAAGAAEEAATGEVGAIGGHAGSPVGVGRECHDPRLSGERARLARELSGRLLARRRRYLSSQTRRRLRPQSPGAAAKRPGTGVAQSGQVPAGVMRYSSN